MSAKTVPTSGLMDQPDIERAKMHANYKVTKEQLVELVECYRQRKYIEDITYLQDKLKGIAGVLDALDVNPEHGISSNTMNTRLQVFGTNHKDPPTRTPYCTLLLGVLDDLMLKILIVCAIFSIVVDMSFATPEERGHAWIEGASILLAVAVVSGISSFSDWRKEGQFLAQLMIEEDTKRVSQLQILNFLGRRQEEWAGGGDPQEQHPGRRHHYDQERYERPS